MYSTQNATDTDLNEPLAGVDRSRLAFLLVFSIDEPGEAWAKVGRAEGGGKLNSRLLKFELTDVCVMFAKAQDVYSNDGTDVIWISALKENMDGYIGSVCPGLLT